MFKKKFIIFIVFGLFFLSKPVFSFSIEDCNGLIFEANLKKGSVGQEVKCLQIILNSNKETAVTLTGSGSPGKETDFFGDLTEKAVIRFQEKYADEILKPVNLKKGNGFVGPKTREKLNKVLDKILGEKKLKVKEEIEGKASYYASFFHGKKTSSGEIFDKNKYTAAHKTLPFGTKVRVVNLSNKKSVIVKINDRGPHVDGRLIDLSPIAARDLGMLTKGLVRVKIQVLQ